MFRPDHGGGAAIHLYLTHPQVRIDPAIPVPLWRLSGEGRARMAVLCDRPWIRRFGRVLSSEETKAWETAEMLGMALGLPVEVRPGLHENDRSATGFLPPGEFEAAADAFFACPDRSVRGWETARAAQARILTAIREATGSYSVPTIFVGHGAVGTLLKCALAARPVSRCEDQPGAGGGNHLGFRLGPEALVYDWRPIEEAPPEP